MSKRARTLSRVRGSVNAELVDQSLRHGVHVAQYANHEVEQVLSMLEKDVLPEYLGKLESRLAGANPRSWTANRTREMVASLDGTLRGGLAKVGKKLSGNLQDFAVAEGDWQALSLTKAVDIPIVNFRRPNASMLRSIVTDRPFEGEVLSDWWSRTASNVQDKVRKRIDTGLAAGESGPDIARAVRGAARSAPGFERGTPVEVLKRNSEAITRTAVSHVSTHAREATFKENDDMIKGIRVVATLDGRTTPICQSLDGKIFKPGEGRRPPFHWNCRTTVVPVLKSAAELGLPFDDSLVPPGRRAALGGDVPETETYQTWLKKQPAVFQDRVLGKARADAFRDGRFTVQQFVNDKGQKLTLKELWLADDVAGGGSTDESVVDFVKKNREAVAKQARLLPKRPLPAPTPPTPPAPVTKLPVPKVDNDHLTGWQIYGVTNQNAKVPHSVLRQLKAVKFGDNEAAKGLLDLVNTKPEWFNDPTLLRDKLLYRLGQQVTPPPPTPPVVPPPEAVKPPPKIKKAKVAKPKPVTPLIALPAGAVPASPRARAGRPPRSSSRGTETAPRAVCQSNRGPGQT